MIATTARAAAAATLPVDPRAYWISLGIDPNSQPVVYSPGQVQTVGLPLLMEYRVIPDATAIGINGWDFNIAVNSSSRPTSAPSRAAASTSPERP